MKQLLSALLVLAATLVFSQNASAQLRYQNNKLIIGNTEPVEYYNIISYGAGMYLKCKTSNFFQIDVTPAATRLASHGDQVVFFNVRNPEETHPLRPDPVRKQLKKLLKDYLK